MSDHITPPRATSARLLTGHAADPQPSVVLMGLQCNQRAIAGAAGSQPTPLCRPAALRVAPGFQRNRPQPRIGAAAAFPISEVSSEALRSYSPLRSFILTCSCVSLSLLSSKSNL